MTPSRPFARAAVAGLAVAGSTVLPVLLPGTAQAATCKAPTVLAADSDVHARALGTTDKQAVTFAVLVQDNGCATTSVRFRLSSPGSYGFTDAVKVGAGEQKGQNYWAVQVTFTRHDVRNTDAGTWRTSLTAKSAAGSQTASGPSFTLKRATRLGADAAPEPIRKGRTITVTGTLQRADWQQGRFSGYAGQKVALQWRSTAKGSTYKTLRTVTAGSGGVIRTTTKAGADGCYRFAYAGNGSTAPVSGSSDCVDVR